MADFIFRPSSNTGQDLTGSEVEDGFTVGNSRAVASGTYDIYEKVVSDFVISKVEARTAAMSSASSMNAVTVSVIFGAESDGTDVTFTVDDSDPDNLSFTVPSGTYSGTYSLNKADSDAAITAVTLAAAPACLVLPTIAGTAAAGDTLTATPGLWVYGGADPGDASYAWVNNTDGAVGETSLSYRAQTTDVGDTLRMDETFDGETASSANTASVATGDNVAPTFDGASSTPADGASGVAAGLSEFTLAFSENVYRGSSGQITLRNLTDAEDTGVVDAVDVTRVQITGSTALVDFPDTTDASHLYSIKWDEGVFLDGAGNPLAANSGDTLYNFNTNPVTIEDESSDPILDEAGANITDEAA